MTCDDIKKIISDEFKIDFFGGNRKDDLINCRMVYYYFCKKYASDCISDEILANTIGLKRLAVYHGLKSFHTLYKYDVNLKRIFKAVEPKVLALIKDDDFDYRDLEGYSVYELQCRFKKLSNKIKYLQNELNLIRRKSKIKM